MTNKCSTCSKFVGANGKCKNCKDVAEQKRHNLGNRTPKESGNLLEFHRSLSGDNNLSPSADQTNALVQLIRRVVKEEMSILMNALQKATYKNEILEKENQKLKDRCKSLAAGLEQLSDEIDEMNQYSRRNNLLITGIP